MKAELGDGSMLAHPTSVVGLSLIGVLLIGLLMRIVGVDYPHRFYIDELDHVPAALRMVATADLSPETYHQGVGYSYALALVYWVLGALATLSGHAANPAAWAAQFGLQDVFPVQVGRWLNVFAGTLTVLVVYAVGRSLYGQRAALVASAIMAVAPLAVDWAHFAKEDVLGALWLSIGLLGAARALKTGGWRWYVVAAAGAGLAHATRYHGAFVLLALVAAHFAREWPKGRGLVPALVSVPRAVVSPRLLAGVVLAPLFFAVAHPYAVRDPAGLLQGLRDSSGLVYGGHYGFDLAPGGLIFTPYLYQLGAALPFGLGVGAYLLAAVGLLTGLVRPRRADWPLLAFGASYLLVSGSFNLVFLRYYVPLVIPAALLAGRVVASPGSLRTLAAVAATAALCYTAAFSASTTWRFLDDTRLQADRWSKDQLEPGSSVALAASEEYTPTLDSGAHQTLRYDRGPDVDWFDAQAEAPDYLFLTSLVYQRAYRDPASYQRLYSDYERLRRGQTPFALAARFEAPYVNKSLYLLADPMFEGYYVSPTLEIYRRCGDPPCRPLWARQIDSAPAWLRDTATALGQLSAAPGLFETPRLVDHGLGYGIVWGSMAVPTAREKQVHLALANPSGYPAASQRQITDSPFGATHPTLVWTGHEFGLAWEDRRAHPELEELYFRRFSQQGEPLAGEVRLTRASEEGQHSTNPALVWNGDGYGLAFDRHLGEGNFEVFFVALSTEGHPVGTAIRLTDRNGPSRSAALAWTGRGYGVVWEEGFADHSNVFFTHLDARGKVAGPLLAILPNGSTPAGEPALVWTGEHFGVAWRWGDQRWGRHGFAILDEDGRLAVGPLAIGADTAKPGPPALAWTGADYAMTWSSAAGKLLLRRFDGGGQPFHEPLLVNVPHDSRAQRPALAAGAGRLGAVWSDATPAGVSIVMSVIGQDDSRFRPIAQPSGSGG